MFANVYHYKGPLGEYSFHGYPHSTRALANEAAAHELSVERNTTLIGVWRTKGAA